MSALYISLVAFILLGAGYLIYAKRLERLWQVDFKKSTPANYKFDNVDYVPARNWLVLFGHHFSSIAGAGPIIGPVIAVALWGWLPALLWVVLGSIFIGGVHDFGSLITSVKEGGSSISDIAGRVISKRAKILTSLFLWFTLILIISVFAYLCADTFVKEPKIVLPSLGLIPVALLIGYLLYYLKVNSFLATSLGLILLLSLILLGNHLPVTSGVFFWLVVLFLYSYLASILPVNLLLQPRDYLASFLLFFGILIGYLGILFSRPQITMPSYTQWAPNNLKLWPMLFVTVACGAVSGFHALISSGTTSKQINSQRHAKRIGYGGMVVEALLAVIAIISVGIIFKTPGDASLALKSIGPIGIFAQGFNALTKGFLGDFGGLIAVTILNAFILTTLDTATRILRYLTEELFQIKNRYLSTAIIVLISLSLALSGQWNKVWPAFGAANQLVATLALFVLGAYLLSKSRPSALVFLPAIFMLATSMGALALQAFEYIRQRDLPLFIITLLLLLLASFMTIELIFKVIRRKKDE
ncbi:MAG: carbon starvation protein A [Candidatus Omnitrophota bacterium]